MDRPAKFIGHRAGCGSSRPPIRSTGVLELEVAAVLEMEHGLTESLVGDIASRLGFGNICKHFSRRWSDELHRRQSVYLRAN